MFRVKYNLYFIQVFDKKSRAKLLSICKWIICSNEYICVQHERKKAHITKTKQGEWPFNLDRNLDQYENVFIQNGEKSLATLSRTGTGRERSQNTPNED